MNKFLLAILAAAATNPLVSVPTVALVSSIAITTIAAPAQAAYLEGIYINVGGRPYYYGSYANTGAPVYGDSTWECMGENGRLLAHGTGATPRWIWGLVQRFFGG
jgi:hypothetical protein